MAQPLWTLYYISASNCLHYLFQKSRSEESRRRPVIDRKRKFWHRSAHDSEGSAALPSSVVACLYSLWNCRTQPASSSFPRRILLILVSSVFNSRVVSGSRATLQALNNNASFECSSKFAKDFDVALWYLVRFKNKTLFRAQFQAQTVVPDFSETDKLCVAFLVVGRNREC